HPRAPWADVRQTGTYVIVTAYTTAVRRLLRCTSTRKVDESELGMSMEQLEEDRAELAQMMGADDEDRDDVGTEDLEHTLLDPFGYVRTFELLLKDAEFAAVICDE